MVGRTVGSYELTAKLGEGGMGAVYKGVDLMVEREVAIKVLRPEIARQPEILERFRAEAVALAKLNHPHIATLYSFFREGDEYYMVMEFVMGRTLDAIIKESSPLPCAVAVVIASQVLEAVEHAHSHGILHRDIKPPNIMLTGSGQVKVMDFGIARLLGQARLTREGCAYGTLEYLAPERIRGEEGDVRSDLYSVGVVLYEMLSSHSPFSRTTEFEMMRAQLEDAPPAFAEFGLFSIPPKLEMVVNRALAKARDERFSSAAEFRSALAGFTAEAVSQPSSISVESASFSLPAPDPATAVEAVVEPKAAHGRSHRKLYAVAALVLGFLALIAAWAWTRIVPAPAAVETARPTSPTPAVESPTVAVPGAQQVQPAQLDSDNASGSPAIGEKTSQETEPRSQARQKAQSGRRAAALKALEKDGADATKTTKDRRSLSLDALQK